MAIYSRAWNWSVSGQLLAGQIRTDSGSFTAGQLWLSDRTSDGLDVSANMPRIGVGASIRLQVAADASRYANFRVSAAGQDKGSYWLLPVTPLDSAGTVPSNNTACQVWVADGADSPGARVCTDYDANGFVIHQGVALSENNPNTVGTLMWCQYCHAAYIDVPMRWSV